MKEKNVKGNGDQRVRLSKKMLKDALISLLEEKPINKVSVRELCERAEINRTTFYKYYGSPYELFADMENDVLDTFADWIKLCEPEDSQLEKLLAIIDKNVGLYRILFNNNTESGLLPKIISLPEISEQIEKVANDERFAQYPEYTNDFFVWGSYKVILNWLNKENRESPKELADFINKLYDGIGINNIK